MDSDTGSIVRWTIGSGLALGLLFVVMAMVRAAGADVSLFSVAAPMAAFGVVGLTVGGLVGPLVRGLWKRRSS